MSMPEPIPEGDDTPDGTPQEDGQQAPVESPDAPGEDNPDVGGDNL